MRCGASGHNPDGFGTMGWMNENDRADLYSGLMAEKSLAVQELMSSSALAVQELICDNSCNNAEPCNNEQPMRGVPVEPLSSSCNRPVRRWVFKTRKPLCAIIPVLLFEIDLGRKRNSRSSPLGVESKPLPPSASSVGIFSLFDRLRRPILVGFPRRLATVPAGDWTGPFSEGLSLSGWLVSCRDF
ncbi:hypothetical protein KSP40_PGU010931 [Platanthera guangdongensis]|uniref:Uncharacterized protein n=1 Tax=Platanthera guangdongensis TaxID=2320717 RepID=A0ABR2M9A6_9ASPA